MATLDPQDYKPLSDKALGDLTDRAKDAGDNPLAGDLLRALADVIRLRRTIDEALSNLAAVQPEGVDERQLDQVVQLLEGALRARGE
ncbi:MAG: hypothetical protein U5L04_00925 [Trueperaceae bacterium]|nr:hypothetical protein [Trueperaceae bacterium]